MQASALHARFAGWLRTLTILLALLCGAGLLDYFNLLQRADASLSDLRFQLGSRQVSGDLVLVDIDASSLDAIGVWPWPRTLYAELVPRLESLGAAQIAFDVDFSARSSPVADAAFSDALSKAGIPVFLAAFGQKANSGGKSTSIAQPIAELQSGGWPALVNVPLEADGMVRRFPGELTPGGTQLQSMPSLLAARETSADTRIDYSIAADRLAHYSFTDVLDGKVPADAFKDKTVIIGATALELRDFFRVPRYGTIPGSEIIALATETLLQNRSLTPLPGWSAWLALGIIACALFASWRDGRVILPLAVLLLATEAGAAYLQLARAQILPTAAGDLILLALIGAAIARELGLRKLLLRLARREAANTRRMLERVVDDGFDAIVILDEKEHVVHRNGAAQRLLGAQGLTDALLPEPVVEAVAVARQSHAAGKGGSAVAEIELPGTGDGPCFMEYTISPFDLLPLGGRRDTAATFVAVTLRDVTERRQAEAAMQHMAMHDALTGLLNRRGFERLLSTLTEGEPLSGALVAFDLDRFKNVNDTHGHAVGDQLLVEVARRASACLPQGAALARMGGDEFAALIPGTPAACAAAADSLLDSIGAPLMLNGRTIHVSASAGLAHGVISGCSLLSRYADLALQEAKAQGADRPVVFDPILEERYHGRLLLEQDLALALERNEFHLVFQPQIDLRSGAVTGAEALLRWTSPSRGAVSPGVFIPVAEEAGLVHTITSRVLQEACKAAAGWSKPIVVAVNLSAIDLRSGDLLAVIDNALAASGLPASRLELEITETAAMTGGAAVTEIFEAIRARGIHFAIDDFGTGYSSLSYLHRYPFSMLKIDKSFVDSGPTDAEAMTILGSVIGMARALGLKSLAEGIETAEQRDALRLLGCERGQGYLFSKPLGSAQFEAWLELQNSRGSDKAA